MYTGEIFNKFFVGQKTSQQSVEEKNQSALCFLLKVDKFYHDSFSRKNRKLEI